MSEIKMPKWLEWAREIQQLCQTGLAFSSSDYDSQRYTRLTEIAAEIISNYSQLDEEQLLDIFLAHPGYATPKIDIRAAIIKDQKILLVQEKMDNKWALPGGWADVGETPSKAIIRETKEESGLDIIPKKIIGIYDANRDGRPLEFFHAYKIVFLCEIVGGETKANDETIDVDFFSIDNLPLFSTSRTNQKHIADIKNIIMNQNAITAFE